MKHIVAAIVLASTSVTVLAQTQVGIASGQPTGTNYPMIEDIRNLNCPGFTVNNVITNGSMENIQKVYDDKKTQYGIAQEDALVYMQGVDRRMMEKIVMVFPFFSTEVHLVVKQGSNIKSLADLQGKRVIEGPDGSGTWVTTQVIKSLTGYTWQPRFDNQGPGMQAVLNGQADAMFINAGKPVGLLEKTSGYTLVPISDPKLDAFKYYTRTMIPSGTYPGQTAPVSTYKVNNGLITYDFQQQYHQQIAGLVTCITSNLGKLQATGHAKWRDVDPLSIDRVKWPSHPVAVKAIKSVTKVK